MEFKLGSVSVTMPDDYSARMFVTTAPEKERPPADPRLTVNEPSFARNVTVAMDTVAPGTTEDQYADKLIAEMESGLQDFQLLERGSTITIQGAERPFFVIGSKGPGGRLLHAITAYVVEGTTAYTLSASNLAGAPFNKTKSEYIAIFQSACFAGSETLDPASEGRV